MKLRVYDHYNPFGSGSIGRDRRACCCEFLPGQRPAPLRGCDELASQETSTQSQITSKNGH